jgi:hypothetical protein
MELSPSGEATSRSATQEFFTVLWNPNGSLPFPQNLATGHYPWPDEFSPYHGILFL